METHIADTKADIRSLEKSLTPQMRSTEFIGDLIKSRNKEMEQISEEIARLRRGEEDARQNKSQTDRLKSDVRSAIRWKRR